MKDICDNSADMYPGSHLIIIIIIIMIIIIIIIAFIYT